MREGRRSVAAVTVLAASLAAVASVAAQKPQTGPEFDKATAGMNRHAIAEYVFRTYDCQACHVATAKGEAGFTPRGNEARQGFVGCVRLLAAVNATLGTAAKLRTADEQRKQQNFREFGCTFCHKPTPGKMGFTEIGQKLGALHLGCIQVSQEEIGRASCRERV